ncbi:chitin deacetylase [Hesseltinella vesiculosa]|uniref:Chitin deacetylase n=1 Tax=Hesseltinella vesiculosa TaxID=101127 RepID=A0A1X2GDF7_9FUNG|nr:chitin deacetylase [Hesseltinella vesiculosa]
MRHLQTSSLMLMTIGGLANAQQASSSTSGLLPQSSPAWLPSFPKPPVTSSYPTGPYNVSTPLSHATLNLSTYPKPWAPATTNHPEVQSAYDAIDWSKVPNAPIHKDKPNGDISFSGYNSDSDPFCWWSDTNCLKPKVDYLPEDVSYCPTVGDWGLSYDDGPFNYADDPVLNNYSEPQLYNFLANQNNQKATLFYIGSNVATYPAAAQRALNDGHVLCVHTWSHPQMTTQTNKQVVAELYWTLRAIKEATGVTPKCWRPPFGDVDDRVRSIAYQMGMVTMIWDEDSNDWDMPGEGGGKLPWDTVMGYFKDWVEARKNGTDNESGHIVLEHELNNATVKMTETWLPTLQQVFDVKSIHDCMGITQPYWETQYVYPANASGNKTHDNATASTAPSSSSIAVVTAAGASQQASSFTSNAFFDSPPSLFGLAVAVSAMLFL